MQISTQACVHAHLIVLRNLDKLQSLLELCLWRILVRAIVRLQVVRIHEDH